MPNILPIILLSTAQESYIIFIIYAQYYAHDYYNYATVNYINSIVFNN